MPVFKNIIHCVEKASSTIKNGVIQIIKNILDWLDIELKEVSGSGLDEKRLTCPWWFEKNKPLTFCKMENICNNIKYFKGMYVKNTSLNKA